MNVKYQSLLFVLLLCSTQAGAQVKKYSAN